MLHGASALCPNTTPASDARLRMQGPTGASRNGTQATRGSPAIFAKSFPCRTLSADELLIFAVGNMLVEHHSLGRAAEASTKYCKHTPEVDRRQANPWTNAPDSKIARKTYSKTTLGRAAPRTHVQKNVRAPAGKFGQQLANVSQVWPNLSHVWPSLAEIGADLTNTCQDWPLFPASGTQI